MTREGFPIFFLWLNDAALTAVGGVSGFASGGLIVRRDVAASIVQLLYFHLWLNDAALAVGGSVLGRVTRGITTQFHFDVDHSLDQLEDTLSPF